MVLIDLCKIKKGKRIVIKLYHILYINNVLQVHVHRIHYLVQHGRAIGFISSNTNDTMLLKGSYNIWR